MKAPRERPWTGRALPWALFGVSLLSATLAAAQGLARAGKPKGEVSVRGTLTAEGVECQALRGDDGRLYTLTGHLQGFSVGDQVHVTGTVAERSTCQQGITLTVRLIQLANTQGDTPPPTGERRPVLLTGTLTDEGVECQAFRSEQGELYTLTGDLRSFKTGDRVTLSGALVDGTVCQRQGKTVQVRRIERAKGKPS